MTSHYFLTRITGRDANLRAGDADRERIAEQLRQSHTEGRLDLPEFQERLEHCYEAKTFGELDELVRDLPRQDEPVGIGSPGALPHWRWRLMRLVPVLLVLLGIAALTGRHDHGWLWIPLLFLFWRISWLRRRRVRAGGWRGPGGWA